jgi:hypothetical protein
MLSLIYSCNEKRIIESEIPSAYKNLKEKDDVLFNLELAYDERNIDEYIKLLDQGFTFFLSPQDYTTHQLPHSLNREEDITATRNFFGIEEPGASSAFPFIHEIARNPASIIASSIGLLKAMYLYSVNDSLKSLKLVLYYSKGDDTWAETFLSQYPNEIGYEKLASADFIVEQESGVRIQILGIESLFVIRHVEVEGDSIWNIAQWYDLGQAY